MIIDLISFVCCFVAIFNADGFFLEWVLLHSSVPLGLLGLLLFCRSLKVVAEVQRWTWP